MKKSLAIVLCVLQSILGHAQTELKTPEASQAAHVMQRIGLTDINISYHSPLVNGRKIWGELVPYNEVWRAGANENTTIAFSTDVKIDNKDLAAGTYGLHMIPSEKEWIIIFSKDNAAWGSYFYDKKIDALRITVTPKISESQDWLSYTFVDLKAKSVIALLKWEKMNIPFTISADVTEVVYQSMHKELTNLSGFYWQGYNQAANFCLANKVHLDDASKWIDKSIEIQKTFANLNTKSKLLALEGKQSEADAMKKDALKLADEAQLNTYGYALLGQKKTSEAIVVFRSIVKQYPNSWNAYDSLAESLENSGDKKGALENYKIALSKAPEAQKNRISASIKKLETK